MTLEQRRFRAEDAKQLMENKLLKEAFAAVGSYIDSQTLTCDPENTQKAMRLVVSKQLLAAIQRELYRHIEDGYAAEVLMKELEERKRSKFSLFSR